MALSERELILKKSKRRARLMKDLSGTSEIFV